MTETFLTTDEAAAFMRLTPAGLRNRFLRGDPESLPPHILDGRRRLFPAKRLEAWMLSRLVEPARRVGRPTKAEQIKRATAVSPTKN